MNCRRTGPLFWISARTEGSLGKLPGVQKHNFFGAYTESFDLMREELKRAREGEYQANLSKKELVAELSHDIKTPIATIQATCEVLNLRTREEDTRKKLTVIQSKADTVSRLVDNMFHATLEELTVLKVEPEEVNALEIQQMFQNYEGCGEIQCRNEIMPCLLVADKIRLEQAVDNIINNSLKYAGTKITVTFREEQKGVCIQIRDEGPGVSKEELAMITGKFYRGSNAKGKAGSGLGLYLSRLFLEQMGGGLECSLQEGFVVELFLKKG